MRPVNAPDVLVLGVGGILGEAWMSGFLAGASRGGGIDFTEARYFVGSSAGSIVAAGLAAGAPLGGPDAAAADMEPGAVDTERTAREGWGRRSLALATPVARVALGAAAPAGAIARAALLARMRQGRIPLDRSLRPRIAALGARFDGRLRVVAVDMRSGRRVVFGAPGAPPAPVPEAVMASCAVPGLFRPVEIDGREYVDGGVWSPTNLDVAPVEGGTRVLCLVPTATLEAAPEPLFRSFARGWRVATGLEAAAARSRGARVAIIEPEASSAAAMAGNLMDAGAHSRVRSLGFAQGLNDAGRVAG
jgi:NTE family protein